MNNIDRYFIFFASTLFAIFIGGKIVFAASPMLMGKYAVNGETVCLASTTVRGPLSSPLPPGPVIPSGFDPETLAPNKTDSAVAFTFVRTFSFHGVRIFNGDGTGTTSGRIVAINAAPTRDSSNFTPSVSSADVTAEFEYHVDPDGTIHLAIVPETFIATALDVNGQPTGLTATNSGFAFKGRASVNGQVLTMTTDLPVIETVEFSNGNVQERICHRSRVHVWLGN